MTIPYMRKDRKGNPVEVEIWIDEKTSNLVRIKRVTYLKDAGFMTFRTDIYNKENEEEFQKYLEEEIIFLEEYNELLEKMNMIVQGQEKAVGESGKIDRLVATVAMLKGNEKSPERTRGRYGRKINRKRVNVKSFTLLYL